MMCSLYFTGFHVFSFIYIHTALILVVIIIIISYIDDNVCFDSGIHDYYDCTITHILIIIRRIMIVMMIIRIPYFWNDSITTGKENSTVRMHFVVSCFAHSPLNTLGPPSFFV